MRFKTMTRHHRGVVLNEQNQIKNFAGWFSRPMLRLETLPGVLEATGSRQPQSVFTVDLDADSYDLVVRAVRTRIDRGLYTTTTERAWRVLRAAMSQGPPWRLSMEREEAESLCEWFEKTYDVVSALTDRWPDARSILDAALRGVRAISAAIP